MGANFYNFMKLKTYFRNSRVKRGVTSLELPHLVIRVDTSIKVTLNYRPGFFLALCVGVTEKPPPSNVHSNETRVGVSRSCSFVTIHLTAPFNNKKRTLK